MRVIITWKGKGKSNDSVELDLPSAGRDFWLLSRSTKLALWQQALGATAPSYLHPARALKGWSLSTIEAPQRVTPLRKRKNKKYAWLKWKPVSAMMIKVEDAYNDHFLKEHSTTSEPHLQHHLYTQTVQLYIASRCNEYNNKYNCTFIAPSNTLDPPRSTRCRLARTWRARAVRGKQTLLPTTLAAARRPSTETMPCCPTLPTKS